MHLIRRKERSTVSKQARWMVAASLVAVCGLAACGNITKLTTEQAVADSFSRLQSQSSISVAVSLGLTPTEIVTLSEHNGGKAIPLKAAESLSDASLVFSMATGDGNSLETSQANSDKANSYDIGLRIGSSMPVEIRYVNQTLYGRVQIPQLLQDFGQPASDGQSVEGALTRADQYVPGLAALAEGRWVSVSQASLQPLLGLLKTFGAPSAPGGQSSSASSIGASVQKLENGLKNAFKNNASFSNAGTTGGRTRYNVTVALKSFLEQAGPAVKSFVSSLPGGLGANMSNANISKAAAKVPAHATMQLYVKNDKAQEIVVDVNQFLPASQQLPFAVPVQVFIGEPGAVLAPTGAKPLDLSNLGGLVAGIMGGHSSSSSHSASALSAS
jgi:hypothetical protein